MRGILKSFYQKYYKNYQAEYLSKKELRFFEKCKNILDIGCGEGSFVQLDPIRIVGIDHNRKSLSICKNKHLSVVYGKVTKLPFANKSFDGVHCAHVIEHLFPIDAHKMLNEIGRVLRKKGVLVLSTPILRKEFYNDFTHIKPYNPESIIRYLVYGEQKTLEDIEFKFKRLRVYWRFSVLPLPGRAGYLLANYLYQFHIHSLQKDAYTLVLEKET